MTVKGIIFRAGWWLEAAGWFFAAPVMRRLLRASPPAGVTMGIVTFKDRYDSCLKGLLKKMVILFPHDQITVVANGHYQKKEQEAYIRKLNDFCGRYSNVRVESYVDPVGLSFLWNNVIRNAVSDQIFIFNDDIKLKYGFRKFIIRKEIMEAPVAIINRSMSHFKISAEVPGLIGFFDEGFREIGGEDDDYLARLAIAGIEVKNFTSGTVAKRKLKTPEDTLNSYGKNMSEQRGGYSTADTEYLESKWIMSDTYFEGSVYVPDRIPKFWKLKNAPK
jgi:hypothetical protein